jgi:hypothetical protein
MARPMKGSGTNLRVLRLCLALDTSSPLLPRSGDATAYAYTAATWTQQLSTTLEPSACHRRSPQPTRMAAANQDGEALGIAPQRLGSLRRWNGRIGSRRGYPRPLIGKRRLNSCTIQSTPAELAIQRSASSLVSCERGCSSGRPCPASGSRTTHCPLLSSFANAGEWFTMSVL